MISYKKFISTHGIEKCHPAELPVQFYALTNKWSGTIDGRRVTVYAGCMRHNQTKGVLVLRTLPADSKRVSGKHCTVPENSGALEIVESDGSRLRIRSASGKQFWFQIPQTLRTAA
jgi:hypothetical protein